MTALNEAMLAFFGGEVTTGSVTIANGQTTSGGVQIRSKISGIVMPAALTGTAFYIQVSHDGATYRRLAKSNGAGDITDVSIGFSANKTVGIMPWDICAGTHMRIESNATEGADREFTIIRKSF